MNFIYPDNNSHNFDESLKYAFNFILQTNGWFAGNFEIEPAIYLQITSDNEVNISHVNDYNIKINFPHNWIQDICSALSFQENFVSKISAEDLLTPFLDQRCYKIHTSVIEHFKLKKNPFIYKKQWPQGKPFAVSLTHDVDLTRKYGIKSLSKTIYLFDWQKVKPGLQEVLSSQNSYWTFPELLRLYRESEWKATFFFLARGREGLSYRYNINTQKFKNLFSEILNGNHEIGLHTSKFAFDYPERIIQEKQRLEKILKLPVNGVRQHYLRLTFPTAFQNFQDAHFAYDSSCGFNELMGFRTGTSFPFQSWNPNTDNFLNLTEVPFSVMDYSWIENHEDDKIKWKRFIKIADSVKQVNGLLNILWHPSNLAEKPYDKYWDQLIEWLMQQDFYQATLNELVHWWKIRGEIELTGMNWKNEQLKLNLSSPEPVENLTLGFIFPKRIRSEDSNLIIRENNGEFVLTIKKLNRGENSIFINYG